MMQTGEHTESSSERTAAAAAAASSDRPEERPLLRDRNYPDMTERTRGRDVFRLSLPIFVELFMQIMVGNVDQIMLSHLGTEPAAAVGNALQVLNIVTVALSAMATASTVLITRALGANRKDAINRIASLSAVVNAVVALLITVLLFAFAHPLFRLLNIDPTLEPMATAFLLIVGSGTLFQGLYFTFTAILRSYSRTADVMWASLFMNIVNIGGCLLLVNGYGIVPELGVEGSAIANLIARVMGCALVGWLMVRHTDARMGRRYLRPWPGDTLKRMLGIGLPSSGEQMSYDLSQTVILSFVNIMGQAVTTTRVYCNMFASMAYIYSIAISEATQIVIGYLVGRRKFSRIPKRAYTADAIAIGVSVSVSVLLWWNCETLVGLLTTDRFIIDLAKTITFIEIFTEIGRSLNIVMVRVLISLGDVKTPVTMNVISSWTLGVGGGYLLGIGCGWGLPGVWIAMTADEWLRGIFFVVKFATKRWGRNFVPDHLATAWGGRKR